MSFETFLWKLFFSFFGIKAKFLHCPESCAPSLRASSSSPSIMVNPVAQQAPKSPRTMQPSTAVHFVFKWQMTSLTLILTQCVGTKDAREVRSSPAVLKGCFFKINLEVQVQNRLKTTDWVSWCFMCLPNIQLLTSTALTDAKVMTVEGTCGLQWGESHSQKVVSQRAPTTIPMGQILTFLHVYITISHHPHYHRKIIYTQKGPYPKR